MRKEKVIRNLWLGLFILLFLPLIQQGTKIIKMESLKGVFETAPDVKFSKGGWWEGSYQEQKSKYINDNIGFRRGLVRLNRQMDFSLFRRTEGIIVLGKDENLFYRDYIDAGRGGFFFGYDNIHETVLKMKYLDSVFASVNKTFALIIAPSKPEIYPEFLPDHNAEKLGPLNHEVFKKVCDSLGVKCIDFNDYYRELKKVSPYRLFTKQGIHWSLYGAMYAVDSIISFVERERNIRLLHPDWSVIRKSDTARGADDDIARTLNLIYPLREQFVYPDIRFAKDTIRNKPSAIYIGDSFNWILRDDSLMKHAHGEMQFWSYFKEVFVNETFYGVGEVQYIDNFDWQSNLDKADCIFLLYTTVNMYHIHEFIDPAYEYYKGKEAAPVKDNTPAAQR